jgi:lauroyl/myristoyl acyltransferase
MRPSEARPSLYERLQQIALPPLLRAARRLPPRLGVGLIVAAAIGQTMIDPPRCARAIRWVSRHHVGWRARAASLFALLVNRGRFLAWAIGIGHDPEAFRSTVVIEGRAWLDEAVAKGGVLLVTVHLGPGSTARSLRACGYAVVAGGAGFRFTAPDPPAAWKTFPRLTRVLWSDPGSRATGLYALARSLRQGSLVVLPADAPDSGRVEFSLRLFGRSLHVHSGWFTLRRMTQVPTLLVLQAWSRGQWTVTVHPPLPLPVPDLERDRMACHAYMLDALGPFVAAHPDQCVSLALRPERQGRLDVT